MANEKHGFMDILRALKKKNMLIVFLIGFACGTPYLLTLRTLQAWMTESQVNLSTIGFFALAGLPYTLKFLWSPIFDRYSLPFGRRRGWLFLSQAILTGLLVLMALTDPKMETLLMAALVLLVSFVSASQDIVADAYRREVLEDHELGLGSSVYITGYFIAMWVTGGLALGLAEFIPWPTVYLLMAGVMSTALLVTYFADEPPLYVTPPQSLKEAMIEPLIEFFKRSGAIYVLLFVLIFKVGDAVAGSMLTPFYLQMGYSKLEIAAIAKTLSLPFKIFGGFLGGALIIRMGLMPALWVFGIFQALSTLSFASLALVEHSQVLLGTVIIFEDVTASMGTAAFVAFMATMTNRKFTATQYALLSSLSGVPLRIFSGFAGVLAENSGWVMFFVICTLMAIPGMALIPMLRKSESPS